MERGDGRGLARDGVVPVVTGNSGWRWVGEEKEGAEVRSGFQWQVTPR